MDCFENLLKNSNEKLEKMDIRQLEYELNNYFVLLSSEHYDNSIIMQKIIYIKYLIKEKKNQ